MNSFYLVTGLPSEQPRNRYSVPRRSKRFSLFQNVQTGSGANPSSYSVGTTSYFYGGKEGGEGNRPIHCFLGYEWVVLYLHFHIRLNGFHRETYYPSSTLIGACLNSNAKGNLP